MKTDIYQSITDRIIEQLEAGIAPWVKPWSGSSGQAVEPHNAVSGRVYNGVNWLVLSCSDYQSSGWLTFKQALELGGNVRTGEKGTQIVFWQFNTIKDDETGKEKSIPFAKAYTVFNVAQCENLDPAKLKLPTLPVPGQTTANQLAANCGANVQHGGSRAFFQLGGDFIRLPSFDSFTHADHYQSTLAHELTHWTGHKSRLDRQFGSRFGTDDYAFEELVAELGSAFICASIGVSLNCLQHADYIGNWLKILRNDKRAIFTAASKAKQAAEYILSAQPVAVAA